MVILARTLSAAMRVMIGYWGGVVMISWPGIKEMDDYLEGHEDMDELLGHTGDDTILGGAGDD